jgi:hypothetical protein
VAVRLDLGQQHGHHAVLAVDRAESTAAGILQVMPKAELVRAPEEAARNCRPSYQVNQRQATDAAELMTIESGEVEMTVHRALPEDFQQAITELPVDNQQ